MRRSGDWVVGIYDEMICFLLWPESLTVFFQLSLTYVVSLTIKLPVRVFFERIVNETNPSWLSLVENEGEKGYCFGRQSKGLQQKELQFLYFKA